MQKIGKRETAALCRDAATSGQAVQKPNEFWEIKVDQGK